MPTRRRRRRADVADDDVGPERNRARAGTGVPAPAARGPGPWQDAVAHRVTWMVEQQVSRAELRLHPAHLGPIEVSVSVRQRRGERHLPRVAPRDPRRARELAAAAARAARRFGIESRERERVAAVRRRPARRGGRADRTRHRESGQRAMRPHRASRCWRRACGWGSWIPTRDVTRVGRAALTAPGSPDTRRERQIVSVRSRRRDSIRAIRRDALDFQRMSRQAVAFVLGRRAMVVARALVGLLLAAGAAAPAENPVRAWRVGHERELVQEFTALLSIPNLAHDRENIRRNAELIVSMMQRRGLSPQAAGTRRPGRAADRVRGMASAWGERDAGVLRALRRAAGESGRMGVVALDADVAGRVARDRAGR